MIIRHVITEPQNVHKEEVWVAEDDDKKLGS